MKFTYQLGDGRERACLVLEHAQNRQYFLQYFDLLPLEAPLDFSVWKGLILAAFVEAQKLGATVIDIRITEDGTYQSQIELITELGFSFVAERVEYRRDLKDLPDDAGTPLLWANADEELAAQILATAQTGDPASNPDEVALEFLRSELNDRVLTHAPECVQVATYQNQPCAIVIAQINPQTKWSRIAYMGLVPRFRGQGLGKWVHRHGFTMLKQQGGQLYHGGTHRDNQLMQALFQKHQCDKFRTMQEWRYSRPILNKP